MSYWDDMPDAIVVGINQESSKEDDLYISDEDYFPIRGGAKFYEFLGAELVPYLIDKYRVGIFKIVVGHGFSANFITFFAFKKTRFFRHIFQLVLRFLLHGRQSFPVDIFK